MKFILGKKLEMTQRFLDNGDVVPVTAVLATPNVVAQIKTRSKEGYTAVQVGFGAIKKLNKPAAGHLKDLPLARTLKEFRLAENEVENLKRGDVITIETFEKGDKVAVVGTSKGHGFQGGVKRYGFHGHPASHGHKDQERMPGSIGSTGPQRVFKDTRMAGHMGDAQITVKGLEIIDLDIAKNIIYVKGAVPGARNGLVILKGEGELKVQKNAEPVKIEEIPVEVAAESPVATEAPVEAAEEKVIEAPAEENKN